MRPTTSGDGVSGDPPGAAPRPGGAVRSAAVGTRRTGADAASIRAPLVVVTGGSGAGKSTVCLRVVDLARARGLAAGGIVTERRAGSGPGPGLDVVDVATDERRPLAEWDRATGGPSTGRWHFVPEALAFGLAGCRRVTPHALLIVDELGPLELLQHEGWAPLVPLACAHAGPVMVVVRPSLVASFLVLARPRHADIVNVTAAERGGLPSVILAMLGLGL